MPASKKISATLATELALETLSASESLKSLSASVRGATRAYKEQVNTMRSVGDLQGAYRQQIEGIQRVQESELAKIQALINKQRDLDVSTEKGAQQYMRYQNQIEHLTTSYSKQNAEISNAREKLSYYSSGLASLQDAYRKNNELSQSYVERLRAEGHAFQAQKEEISGTKSALSSLKEQYSLQRAELERIGSSLGKDNEAYRKQQVRLNETGKSVAETKEKLSGLRRSLLNLPEKKKINIKTNAEQEEKHVRSLGEIIKGSAIGAGVASVAMAGLNLVTEHVGDAIDRVDTLNNAKRTFSNMGFQAKDTNKAMKALQDSIMGLPTPLNEATKGVEMIASSTHDVKQAQKVWSSLNDAVLGFGGTTDDVSRATRELTEAFSNGKIQGKQWNALMNEGLGPALNAIAKEMHMTTGQLRDGLSSGKISVKQFQDALIQLDTKGGGGLKSLHKIAMDSTKGIRTSFANAVTAITRGLGNVIVGFSTMLKKVTGSNLSTWIKNAGKDAEDALNRLSKAFSGVPKVIKNGMPAFRAFNSIFKDLFHGAIDGVKNALEPFGNAIKNVNKACKSGQAFKEFTKILKDIASHHAIIKTLGASLGAVATGIMALKVAEKVTAGLSSLFSLLSANPFGAVVIAISAVVTALVELYKQSPKFRHFCQALLSATKSAFATIGKIIHGVTSTFGKAVNDLNHFCGQMADYTMHMANNVSHWFDKMGNNIHKSNVDTIRDAKKTFRDGYSAIQDETNVFHDIITGKWSKVGGDISKLANDLRSTVHDIFSGMYDRLNDLTGGALDKIRNKWDKMWRNIVNGIEHACASIGHKVSDLVNDAIRPVNDMLKGITKGINWVLDKFGASKISAPSISLVHFAKGGVVGQGKGQLAMVNDGAGNHYREMFATPDGKIGAFGTDRNIMTFLPSGTQVLDGERSHQLATLLDIPHFKDGTKDKNLFEKIFDKGKDILEDIADVLKHPIKFLEKVLKKFLDIKPSKTWVEGLITHAPSFFAKMGKDWLVKLAKAFQKKQEESGDYNGKGSPNSANGVLSRGDFAKIARHAADLMHQSLSDGDIDHLYHQAMIESTANPACGPGIDDHDGTGRPVGLFQYKLSTWASWAVKDHQNIHSALDQIMAVLNDSNWRSDLAPMNSRRGWGPSGHHMFANGGFVSGWTNAIIGEAGPEVVIPLSSQKQGRALDLLTRTVNKMNQTAGRNTTITTNDNSGLESKLDTMIGLLANILGVNQEQLNKTGNGLNLQGLYQKQYQDQALNNYQAY